MGYLVSHLREALLLMALNIRTAHVREAIRYEPTPPTKPKEAVDSTRFSAFTYLASPLHEGLFFRRVFFAPPDALSWEAMIGGLSAPGITATGAGRWLMF